MKTSLRDATGMCGRDAFWSNVNFDIVDMGDMSDGDGEPNVRLRKVDLKSAATSDSIHLPPWVTGDMTKPEV